MNTVSIIVLVALAILTLVQVMRISEVSEIQGGKDNVVSEKDNDTQGRLMLLVGMGLSTCSGDVFLLGSTQSS